MEVREFDLNLFGFGVNIGDKVRGFLITNILSVDLAINTVTVSGYEPHKLEVEK